MLAILGHKFGWRRMQVVGWIFFLAGLLFLALPFVQGFSQLAWRRLFSNLSTATILLSIGFGGIVLIPHIRRRFTLFDAAFASPMGNVPMVTNQPMPASTPINSPITIRRRIRWPAALMWHTIFFLVTTSVMAGFTVGYALLEEHLAGTPPAKLSVTILIIIALTLVCGLVTLILLVMLPWRQQTLRIIDEGVIQVETGRRSEAAWKDVRVFALVAGGKRPGSAAVYTLNTGKSAVRWIHRASTRWYSITAPNTSDEEYQRQMSALLSYAAARTRLPLLDLR